MTNKPQDKICGEWIEKLRSCDVRVEMKSTLDTRNNSEVPDVLGQELLFSGSSNISPNQRSALLHVPLHYLHVFDSHALVECYCNTFSLTLLHVSENLMGV